MTTLTDTSTLQPAPDSPAKEVTINVPVPAELHRAVKIWAAENGCTLKDAVTKALADLVP